MSPEKEEDLKKILKFQKALRKVYKDYRSIEALEDKYLEDRNTETSPLLKLSSVIEYHLENLKESLIVK